jgi:predicted MPP superfamily phosphohydrolase
MALMPYILEASEAPCYGVLGNHDFIQKVERLEGYHIINSSKGLPRRFVRGRWRSAGMQGYTSPGTGSSGVAARLNCPPEITLHVLRNQ